MTTTEPTATKHWHAQSAEQVCAGLEPGGTRSGGAMTAAFQKVALLLAAAGIGAVAIRLRQPLILAYIVAMTPWQEPSA